MLSVILTIVGIVVGLIASWFFSAKFAKSKKPYWHGKMNQLFQEGLSTIDNLKITYKDSEIDNLSSTYIAFWNNGKETVKGDEIAEDIKIRIRDGEIYDAQVIFQTTQSNEFCATVSEDKRSVSIVFRYMDYKEGVVIQFLSNCLGIEEISLRGKMMGCRKIKQYRKMKLWQEFLIRILLPLFLLLAIVFIAAVVDGAEWAPESLSRLQMLNPRK